MNVAGTFSFDYLALELFGLEASAATAYFDDFSYTEPMVTEQWLQIGSGVGVPEARGFHGTSTVLNTSATSEAALLRFASSQSIIPVPRNCQRRKCKIGGLAGLFMGQKQTMVIRYGLLVWLGVESQEPDSYRLPR